MKRHMRLAGASTLALGIAIALAPTIVQKTKAFTLIEDQLFFAPVLLGTNQGGEVAVNNTFGSHAVHVTITFFDAMSGTMLGQAMGKDVAPGQGLVELLPAVQKVVSARVTLTPATGTTALPRGIENQIGASFHVFDKTSNNIVLLVLPYMPPAVN